MSGWFWISTSVMVRFSVTPGYRLFLSISPYNKQDFESVHLTQANIHSSDDSSLPHEIFKNTKALPVCSKRPPFPSPADCFHMWIYFRLEPTAKSGITPLPTQKNFLSDFFSSWWRYRYPSLSLKGITCLISLAIWFGCHESYAKTRLGLSNRSAELDENTFSRTANEQTVTSFARWVDPDPDLWNSTSRSILHFGRSPQRICLITIRCRLSPELWTELLWEDRWVGFFFSRLIWSERGQEIPLLRQRIRPTSREPSAQKCWHYHGMYHVVVDLLESEERLERVPCRNRKIKADNRIGTGTPLGGRTPCLR